MTDLQQAKQTINTDIWCYENGRYTMEEYLSQLEKHINMFTWYIYDIDKKITRKNTLYRYGMKQVLRAMTRLEKHSK